MLAIERQEAIVRLIQQNGNATMSQLVSMFHVSTETIRKDLLLLERHQALRRTHGGAVAFRQESLIQPLQIRKQDRIAQKSELSRYALPFIENGDVIAIDAGSTATELARLVASSVEQLTVVTMSLDVLQALSVNPGIKVILCGGSYIREEFAFGGMLSSEAAAQVHTTKAFICPSALSVRYGITDYSEPLVAVQKAFIANTDQVFILADSEKFETGAPLKISATSPAYVYITDANLPESIRRLYQKDNIIWRSDKNE